uniref:Carboxypeptidase regulatory-like domain-containing protein n=1 Tax=Fervidicoccus fontis TaxID=683846 RepID=A0A7J3ZL51_9CREN
MGKKALELVVAFLAAVLLAAPVAMALTAAPSQQTYYPGDVLVVTGSATPNALVSVTVEGPAGLVALSQARAGGDGSFTIEVMRFPPQPTRQIPYGTYTVTVKDTATLDEIVFTVEFVSPKGTIAGVVTDALGGPVAGATVMVTKDTAIIAITSTDASGKFTVEVLETGTYLITVQAPGYMPAQEQVAITYLPATVDVAIMLQVPKLTVSIKSILLDGKPFAGVAREGGTLEVRALVAYGGEAITDAAVTGYLTDPLREAQGLPPIAFTLAYSAAEGAYVGRVAIPKLGVDRMCSLEIVANARGETASVTREFIMLVDVPAMVRSVEERVSQLERQVGDLSETLSSLRETLDSLQGQLSSLQEQLRELGEGVEAVSGARGLAQAAIALGIVAIIIALATLFYLSRKISA